MRSDAQDEPVFCDGLLDVEERLAPPVNGFWGALVQNTPLKPESTECRAPSDHGEMRASSAMQVRGAPT